MGRFLQEQFHKEPQIVITMPLLEGLDGVHKMSKSLGNAIGLAEPASDVFGKLMSISDTLMWRYFELLLSKSKAEISVLQEKIAQGIAHPMALKKEMAHGIVAQFWSTKEADQALETFESLFQKKDYSKAQPIALPSQNPIWIVEYLKDIGAVASSSDAKRLIESGAVLIDGTPVQDFKATISIKSGMTIKVGKHRIYKVE